MHKDRYPGQTPSLLHRFHPKTLAIPFMLTLFFLLSPSWLPHLQAAGSSPGASPGTPASPITTTFLMNGRFPATGPEGKFGAPFTSAACSLDLVPSSDPPRVPLLGGRVLVAGWVVNRRLSASAELYNPRNETWLAGGVLTSSGDSRNAMFPRSSRTLVWAGIIIPF